MFIIIIFFFFFFIFLLKAFFFLDSLSHSIHPILKLDKVPFFQFCANFESLHFVNDAFSLIVSVGGEKQCFCCINTNTIFHWILFGYFHSIFVLFFFFVSFFRLLSCSPWNFTLLAWSQCSCISFLGFSTYNNICKYNLNNLWFSNGNVIFTSGMKATTAQKPRKQRRAKRMQKKVSELAKCIIIII